jgi:hypothetical protein
MSFSWSGSMKVVWNFHLAGKNISNLVEFFLISLIFILGPIYSILGVKIDLFGFLRFSNVFSNGKNPKLNFSGT